MQLQSFPFEVMGGPAGVHLYAPDAASAERAAAAAIAETRRLEQRYSRYRADSLLAALNAAAAAGGEAMLDPETADLLDAAFAWRAASGGLFDVTSGLLRRAWDFEAGRAPSQAELDALLPRVGMDKLDWSRPRLAFGTAGMELDLGGLVKEYAADRAAAACADAGVPHVLVELAGDIAVAGPQASGAPWTIGLRHPRAPERVAAVVELAAGGLASSGDYERCFEAAGMRCHHILDPRSGMPAQGMAAVSVTAASCLEAGALATIAMLKGADAGAWLSSQGARSLWIDQAGRHGGEIPLAAPLDWPG
jgi:thiamine biosynthesis lipoprotein